MKRGRSSGWDPQYVTKNTKFYSGPKAYYKDAAKEKKKRKFNQSQLPGAAVLSVRAGAIGEVRSVDSTTQLRACPNGLAEWTTPNGGIVPLNIINVGSAFYQRDGSQIAMKSLTFRARIDLTGVNVASQGPCAGRIMILYDKGCNGALPPKGSCLASTDYSGNPTSAVGSYFAPGAKDRFVVLRDNFFALPQVGATGQPPASFFMANGDSNWNATGTDGNQGAYVMNWHIKLNRMLTSYSDSTGSLGDIVVGALYVVFLTGETQVNETSAWRINFSSRLKYYP